MLWDNGTWFPDVPDVSAALKNGDLKFTLHGHKLKGTWVLVRTRGLGKTPSRSAWLLIKHRDQYASTRDIMVEMPESVSSHRLLAEIAQDGGGDVAKARKGDPGGNVPLGKRRDSPSPRKIASRRRS
jgi:bifunctional non-homologous end joining protein LigD